MGSNWKPLAPEVTATSQVNPATHGDKHGAQLAAGTPEPPPPKMSVVEVEGGENTGVDAESHNVNITTETPQTQIGEAVNVEGGENGDADGRESEAAGPEVEHHEGSQDVPRSHSSEGSNEPAPERPIYGVVNKSPLLKVSYHNARERRDTLRLAFSAMKYAAILEKLLEEVTFYMEYPDFKDEEYLILVIVYDYAMRNFQRRTAPPQERSLPDMEKYMEYLPNNRLVMHPSGAELFKAAETAVQAMCLRLAAAVARVRVRNQVGSLRLLLPEEWRQSESLADAMPTYGWYNQLLGKQDIVTGWLKDHGFRRIVAGRLPQQGEYGSDKHCSDVFVFNKADVTSLLDSEVVLQRNLVLQDKSSCLGVHCTLANIAGGEEVLFVNCINVYSAVHMEGLIGNKFPLIQPVPQIRCVRQLKEDEDPRLTVKMGSKVSGIRTVTLLCRTVDPEETEVLVSRVVEMTNRTLLKEAEALAASSRGASTGMAFNLQYNPRNSRTAREETKGL
ncbi:Methyltransferase NSUN7 [Fasciola gigantica]|uniref:Methyltransferase NSUN7 n=1 Tax=Fasciola gigantica TaxID=46835 RepID=A0A504XQG2_FASGI|nr:Methyltransferase NSUN7 [Fasciola gigantica]